MYYFYTRLKISLIVLLYDHTLFCTLLYDHAECVSTHRCCPRDIWQYYVLLLTRLQCRSINNDREFKLSLEIVFRISTVFLEILKYFFSFFLLIYSARQFCLDYEKIVININDVPSFNKCNSIHFEHIDVLHYSSSDPI